MRISLVETGRIVVGRGNNAVNITFQQWQEILFRLINNIPLSRRLLAMLPVGYWPKEKTGKGGNGTPEHPIPERYEFLLELGPVEVIPGISFGRKYNYNAFIIGDMVIVDSIGYGNAIYIFWYEEKWVQAVRETKWINYTTESPAFLTRLYHRGKWQERLKKIMNHLSFDRNLSNLEIKRMLTHFGRFPL